jgi:uncharacterized protein YdhG (YjbR/CyaY superfamily)
MTVEEYIKTFPPAIQTILENIRRVIQRTAPEASETISYGIPTFKIKDKRLVYFAGWKHHVSLYPTPAGDVAFQQKIAPYRKAKSTLQFPIDKPIPYELVEEMVTLLVKENVESAR